MGNDNKNNGMSEEDVQRVAKALSIQQKHNKSLDDTISRQKSITDELSSQKKLQKDTSENYRESVSLSRKLQKALLESTYSGQDLNKVTKNLAKNQNLQLALQQNINTAVKQNGLNLKDILAKKDLIAESQQKALETQGDESVYYEKRAIKLQEGLTYIEDQVLLMDESNENLEEANKLLQIQKESHEDISKALGLSGQGMAVINKLLGGSLGSISKIEASSKERVKTLMEERTILDGNGKVIEKGMVSKMEGLGIQVLELGKSLRANMFDPLVLIGVAFDFSKQSTQLSHSLGLSGQAANDLVHDFGIMATQTGDIALNGKKLQASTLALNKSLGYGGLATKGMAADAAVLMDRWGMTGEHAANFAQSAMASNKTIKKLKMESIASVRAVENQYGRTVDLKGAIQDAAGVTGEMRANFGGSVAEIAKGIATARAFGMELKDLAGSSKSLLNFSSSIESELKAELLTGKQLNLERARAAALTGDMKTLTEELNKNMGSYTDFMGMNVLQREAQAEAMGMTVGQMEEILMKDQNLAKLAQDARNMGNEELALSIEKKDTQQKFLDIVENLKQKFVEIAGGPLAVMVEQAADMAQSILSFIKPVIILAGWVAKIVGWILKIPLVAPIIMTMWAVSKMSGFFAVASMGWKAFRGGLAGAMGGMGRLFKAFKGGGIKGLGKSLSRMGGGGISKSVTSSTKGGDAVGGGSRGSSSGLKSLAKGLKSMGGSGVMKGIAATALAGPALLMAIPAIPFLLFMGLTPMKSLYKNFSALSRGLTSMSKSIVGVGVIAALGVAGALALAAIPFLGFIGIFGVGVAAGLVALGGGLASLGAVAASGLPFLAVALIGALGVAMIPFGVALAFAGAAMWMFGKGIKAALEPIPPIITAVSDAVVSLIDAAGNFFTTLSTIEWSGLLLAGPALISLGVGLAASGAAAIIAAPGLWLLKKTGLPVLKSIGKIGPGLKQTATALKTLSGSIGDIKGVGKSLKGLASGMGSLSLSLFIMRPVMNVLKDFSNASAGLTATASAIESLAGNLDTMTAISDGFKNIAGGVKELSFALWSITPMLPVLALLAATDMIGSSSIKSTKDKDKEEKDKLIDTTEIESLLKKILNSPGMKETKVDTQPAPTDLFQHNSKMGKGVYQRENEGQVLFT